MAELTGITGIFAGNTTEIDTSARHTVGTRARDPDGNEYIYMQGVASCVLGSWVTYDEDYVTTLLTGTSIGPVAVAMAILDATTEYGWWCIWGECEGDVATAIAAGDVSVGYETTAGHVGDGHAAGDQIYGCVVRDAISANSTGTFQLSYPYVDDNSN